MAQGLPSLGIWALTGLKSFTAASNKWNFTLPFKKASWASVLFKSSSSFLPVVSDSNIQQRDPKPSAAVLEHCVLPSRDMGRTTSHSSAGTGTQADKEKKAFELSPPTHQLNRRKTSRYF